MTASWTLPFSLFLTAVILAALRWLLRRAKPVAGGLISGTIGPEKISAAVTVIVGLGMTVAGMVAFVSGADGWAALGVALMGALIAIFMAPSLTSFHNVHWTAENIEGPSKLFGPTLGAARTAIARSDIAKTGTTITSYWYVEAHDRRRVYWSYLYKGHGMLTSALRAHRPDLRPANEKG
jgi:hypothetical protein